MAYLYKDEDEQKKVDEGPVPLSQAGTTIAGTGTGAPTVNQAAPTATPTPTPSRGGAGTFTNLSQYLQQNAPQAQQLGRQVGQFVQDKNAAVQSALNQARTDFTNQVSGATVNRNQQLINQIKETPHEIVKDAQKTAEAKRMRDAIYTGPRQLSDLNTQYNKINTQISDAERIAQALRQEGTRKSVFSEAGIGKNQTLGKNVLNNLLLGSNVQQFDPLLQTTDSFRDAVKQAEAEAQAKATAAQNVTASTGREFQSQLTGKDAFLDQFLKSISEREGKVEAGRTAAQTMAALEKELAKGAKAEFTPEQLALLKTNPAQYKKLFTEREAYKNEAAARENRRLQAIQNQEADKRIQEYLKSRQTGRPFPYNNDPRTISRIPTIFDSTRLPDGNYVVPPMVNYTSRGPYNLFSQYMGPVQFAKLLGLNVPGYTAPKAEQFTTPYDDIQQAIGARNPYADLVAADPQQDALEQAKVAALSELLGIPVTRPNAPADIERINPVANFDIVKALQDLANLRKGVQ